MEVTKENFLEVLPEIEAALKECDFIAIDAEFTGIGTRLPAKVVFDTPSQRYERLKQGLHNIIIIQYGICTFKWNSEAKRYEAKPFNIYIFPRSSKGNEVFFKCQSSSIEFLASQGFDFNKLFYQGLSHMTPPQEERMRKSMKVFCDVEDSTKAPKSTQVVDGDSDVKSPVFIPPSLKNFIDETCSQVETFIENEEEKVLDLAKGSGFRRKITYEVIEERFPSKFHLESIEDDKGEKHIRIIKADEAERRRLKEEKYTGKMAEFETAVGFLKIAKLLSEAGKLIAGHNMLLDMLLTVGQFLTPLPNSLEEFKDILRTFFPKLVDTKLLCSSEPLKGKISKTHLGGLYQFLEENFNGPDIVFSDGFESYNGDADKFHEAGFDAYCTGFCFARMASYLCKMERPTDDEVPIDLDAKLVKAFINRLYVMRINDLLYITIDGPDEIPERCNVFHIEYPSNWRYPEINNLFNEFGNVYIAIIDDTSAFVSLDIKERADDVISKFIIQKRSGQCRVKTYMQYIGKVPLCHYDAVSERYAKEQTRASASPEMNSMENRKRARDESLEDGEVADSSESLEVEDIEVVAKKPKRNKSYLSAIKTEADFYEPDDW